MAAPRTSEVVLTCERCRSAVGRIRNYGQSAGVTVRVRCKCGGSSNMVEVGSIYEVLANGNLSQAELSAEVEDALEAWRQGGRAENG